MNTPNQVALVTAASKGIGAAIARELASRGWKVVLLARSPEIQRIAEDLGGIGASGSVTNTDDLSAMVNLAMEQYGKINAVVHNTGHPAKGDLLKLSEAEWQEGYELILGSVMRLARLVTPIMIRQGGGSIVHISSYAAKWTDLDRPVSSVFRSGLSAWTKLHAEYCAKHSIRVNAVLPGFVDSYPVPPEIVANIPMGRIGKLAELAKVVAFLLSPDSSYITGQNLLVDGGMVRSV